MPPIFKKAKEYDPGLAKQTLSGPNEHAEVDPDRQMLIELGLVDEDAPATNDNSEERLGADAWIAGALSQRLSGQQAGRIAAFHADTEENGAKQIEMGSHKVLEQLRMRLEASLQKLQHGSLDASANAEMRELLFDQQHQIELLLRGNLSLRGNMSGLRRSSKEIDSKNKLLEELEHQHQAALREMEGKLKLAIRQVQALQQANRERQQQQEAAAQLSLSAANNKIHALQTCLDDLQILLASKENELIVAKQTAEHLSGQVAQLSTPASQLEHTQAQLEQERAQHNHAESSLKQQLQQVAAECESVKFEAAASAAALSQAESQLRHLGTQLAHADNAQQELASKYDTACQQLDDLKASTAHEALMLSAQKAAELQQLQTKCTELCRQLEQEVAEKQTVQSQLSDMTLQRCETSDRQQGLQEQLLQAVQGYTELQTKYQDLEASRLLLQVQCQRAEDDLAAAVKQNAAAVTQQQVLVEQQQDLQQQLQQLQTDKSTLSEQLHAVKTACAAAGAQVQALTKQTQEVRDKSIATEAESQQLQLKMSAMQTEHAKAQRAATEHIQQLQQNLHDTQQQLADAAAASKKQIAAVQAAADQQIGMYQQKWRDEFFKRRKLHNLVVELKGNIRVLARVRPLIEMERARAGSDGNVEAPVRVVNEEMVSVAGTTTREYEFDRVFGPSEGQAQVYEEVSTLVTSTLDGFNVCIMAYGQTGSGKTYTIEGTPDNPGINGRALAELFAVAAERCQEISYSFSASVLEIYNEQIYDLLAGSRDTGDKLDVKEGPQGLFIPGLRIEPVAGTEDVTAVLQKGKQNRSTFATNMNEHSSRSHLVLSLYVKAQDLSKGTTWASKLHLIDLAGSERVSRSGAEGERLKEAAAINKSLSALGDVMAALQQRCSHVPYRNSKVTRLLEDSLGGSSKMLMVVNCSPAAENVSETKCSLEFAARARKVELGAAARNNVDAAAGVAAPPTSSSPLRASLGALSPVSGSTGLGSGSNSASSSPRAGKGPRRAGGLQQ